MNANTLAALELVLKLGQTLQQVIATLKAAHDAGRDVTADELAALVALRNDKLDSLKRDAQT